MKILIADDEDTIRRGVAKYIQLHSDKFDKIYQAENGQEALDILFQYRPELVLLDVQMPLKNGIEVMQEAKKAGLDPVIVILSGYDEFKYAQQAIRYGAKEYLLKPVRATDILKCLEKLADEYYSTESEESEQTEGAPINSFVKSAREYVEEHYTDDISLQEVADKIGISAGYLSTMFAQNMNCKFVDYLNKVRIERACTYLEQNYLKTYEIAYRVGFRDEKYFSRVFKKVKGMSPKEYRTGNSQEPA